MQLTLPNMWHGKGELSVVCNSGTHQLIAGLWGRRNESDTLTAMNKANKNHHLWCARDCTLCLPFYFTESSQSLNEVDAIIWLPPLPSENCGTEKLGCPSSHSWCVTSWDSKCYFDSRVWVLIPINSAFRVKELSMVTSFWGIKLRKMSWSRTIILPGLQNRFESLWVPRFTQEAMETGTRAFCQRVLPLGEFWPWSCLGCLGVQAAGKRAWNSIIDNKNSGGGWGGGGVVYFARTCHFCWLFTL